MRRRAGHLDRAMTADAATWTRDAPTTPGLYWYRDTLDRVLGTRELVRRSNAGDLTDYATQHRYEIVELVLQPATQYSAEFLEVYRHGREDSEDLACSISFGGEWWPYPFGAPPANPSADLPEVAGPLAVTLAQLERRARTLLGEEQRKPNPDNAIVAVLCDTVRCVREYVAANGWQVFGHDDLVATDRRRYLAVQAVRYLRNFGADGPEVNTIHYDEADCDAWCLADDLTAAFDLTPEDLEKKP